jgi:hypothetical protein
VAHGAHAPADGRIGDRAWYEGSFAHLAAPVAGYCGRSDWQLQALRLIEDASGAPQEVIAVLRAVKPSRAVAAIHPAPQVSVLRTRDARLDPAFAVVAPVACAA